ncbi:MAG: hypothetical protein ACXAEU_21175 [Candidatus Hodarchaeales archaeon]
MINVFRDFGLTFSTASSILLAYTALILRFGDRIVTKSNITIVIIIVIIMGFLGTRLDTITIIEPYIYYQLDILGQVFLRVIPITCVFYAIFEYLRIRHSTDDKKLRQQLLKLTTGLVFIVVGVVYLAVAFLIAGTLSSDQIAVIPFFLYPGQLLYAAGELMLLWAFK